MTAGPSVKPHVVHHRMPVSYELEDQSADEQRLFHVARQRTANGANFGMADGSVRFISSTIDPSIFALMGSMADGVPVSPAY